MSRNAMLRIQWGVRVLLFAGILWMVWTFAFTPSVSMGLWVANETRSPVLVYAIRPGETETKCIGLEPGQKQHVALASGDSTEMLSSKRFVIVAITSTGQLIHFETFRLGDLQADDVLEIRENDRRIESLPADADFTTRRGSVEY